MYKLLFFIVLIGFFTLAKAQTENEIHEMAKVMTVKEPQKLVQQYRMANQNSNEVQLMLSGMFLMYKAFVSSQDSGHCTFLPSCSVYGLEAVKKRGIFIGIISTFDRLTRCNGLSPENYRVDIDAGLLLDPVE
jgi:putative component of membrane protein insertase Oxa1/YidC/SpoIIIJ protein YidD